MENNNSNNNNNNNMKFFYYTIEKIEKGSVIEKIEKGSVLVVGRGDIDTANFQEKNNEKEVTLQFVSNPSSEKIEELSKILQQKENISELSVVINEYSKGNVDTGEVIKFVIEVLKCNGQIKELALCSSDLKQSSAQLISEFLKNNNTLEGLFFDGSTFGIEVITHLSDMLKTNSSLKTLSMNICGITETDGEKIAEALKINKGLKSLSLNDNELKNDGIAAIAESLKENTTLEELYICGDSISITGTLETIDKMLKDNKSLKTIDLVGTVEDSVTYDFSDTRVILRNESSSDEESASEESGSEDENSDNDEPGSKRQKVGDNQNYIELEIPLLGEDINSDSEEECN